MTAQHSDFDIVIVGAGAAGMAAAICAAENSAGRDLNILMIEGATKPGAKILVSGGGRCNVTNEHVTPEDFWGGSRAIIRNVLAQFDDRRAREWFASMGVELKLEPTGKYFPVTNQARTVLEALLGRIDSLGIRMWTGTRVNEIGKSEDGLSLTLSDGQNVHARCVIMATGGMALPKSGSDGAGLGILKRLGHTIVPTTPSLTPLMLGRDRTVGGKFEQFAGVTIEARMRLHRTGHGKPVVELDGSLLFTHTGLSGPVAMNMSRHWLRERLNHPDVPLEVTIGHPDFASLEAATKWLSDAIKRAPSRSISGMLGELFPDRLATAMTGDGGTDVTLGQMTSERRRSLTQMIFALQVNVTGTRDYSYAEAMAGGVELSEINYHTMESRRVPGLFICGEILDVDGRIGGFNFQWAWSSGYVAGRGAAHALRSNP